MKMPQGIELATAEQVARLNRLLSEVSGEIYRVNFPLASFIPVTLLSSFKIYIANQRRESIKPFVQSMFESIEVACDNKKFSKMIQVIILISVLYLFYKAYTGLTFLANRIICYFFPNGILSFDFKEHLAFKVKGDILSKKDVKKYTDELVKLRDKLKSQNQIMLFLNYAVCVFFPYISNIRIMDGMVRYPRATMSLGLTELGVYWHVRPFPQHAVQTSNVLALHQSQHNSAVMAKIWAYFRLPANQRTFLKSLQDATFTTDWKITEKESPCLYSLVYPRQKELTIHFDESSEIKVTSNIYIAELFRICLKYNLTVFTDTENTRIYISYGDYPALSWKNFGKKFRSSLQQVANLESDAKIIIDALNTIATEKDLWDCYSSIDSKGFYHVVYYANQSQVSEIYRSEYLHSLVLIGAAITMKGNIIYLENMPSATKEVITNIGRTHQNFRKTRNQLLQDQPQKGWSNDGFTLVAPRRRKIAGAVSLSQDAQPVSLASENKAAISFSGQYQFTHAAYEQAVGNHTESSRLPMHLVCPLDVPWLPNGHAFAVLDHDLFHHLRGYLSPYEIESVLIRGKVEGRRGASGTGKTIVGSTDGYQNIHGKNIPAANFKMKFLNNIRIYARYVITANGNVLYIFDGIGFGH